MKNPVFDFCSFAKASEIACAHPKNVFMCVTIVVFWILLSNRLVDGYGSSGITDCLHIHSLSSVLDVEAGGSSETVISHLTNYMT